MIAIQILSSFILFFLVILACFYIPGAYLLSLFNNTFDKEERKFLAWPLGYSLFILLSYASAWIRLPWLPLAMVVLVTLCVFLKKRSTIDVGLPKVNWIVVLLIIVGSLAFTGMSILSGIETKNGLYYIGMVNYTDGLMHIAHIKTQAFVFPPPHAGFAGYAMRGYHYFYDFLLSRFLVFFHFSANDLYYRLFPLVVSLFYGISVYFFSKLFTKKSAVFNAILFFAYFAQSWSFILSLFTKTVDITNGLGLVQPLELILDPSAIFAFALMLTGFYIILHGKFTWQKAITAMLILGPLAQLKVYGGILSIVTLSVLIVYFFIRRKPVILQILSLIGIGLLTAVTYLPNNVGVGYLFAKPFFLYGTFIQQNPLFNLWNWDLRMIIYNEHHNIPHITFMYLVAFTLFWTLTSGSRIALIGTLPALFKKDFWKRAQNIWLVTALAFPLFVGSIFVQSFSIFSTIQFLWIVGLLLVIPAGIFYGNLYERVPRWGKIAIIIFLLFTSAGSFIANENRYLFSHQPPLVTPAQLQFVKKIQQQINQQTYFVVAPARVRQFQYFGAPLFSSLTGRITYYEYETPEYSDSKKIDYRKKQVETITLKLENCDGNTIAAIMKHTGTTYLLTTQSIKCTNIPHMHKLASSGNWIFWQVK